MSAVIVIPARYGSSRFPGKPLAAVAGVPLIERVWRLAKATENEVIVATDDQRIAETVKSFGGEVVMTSPSCRNGTERVSEALHNSKSKAEIIINLQGDACLTPPWIIEAIIQRMSAERSIEIATPAVRLTLSDHNTLCETKNRKPTGGTFVVFDQKHRALYFSRSPIPHLRTTVEPLPVFKHIGLYGYRRSALEQYLKLPESQLEKVEGLEQLRALDFGLGITVVEVDYRGRTAWSIDTPEDLTQVEAIIAKEGEISNV